MISTEVQIDQIAKKISKERHELNLVPSVLDELIRINPFTGHLYFFLYSAYRMFFRVREYIQTQMWGEGNEICSCVYCFLFFKHT